MRQSLKIAETPGLLLQIVQIITHIRQNHQCLLSLDRYEIESESIHIQHLSALRCFTTVILPSKPVFS